MDDEAIRRIYRTANSIEPILSMHSDVSRIAELADQVSRMSLPALQRHWFVELPAFDAARIAESQTAAQIQKLVTTTSGLHAANVIQSTLFNIPDALLQRTLAESLRRIDEVVGRATSVALVDWANRIQDRAEREADDAIRSKGWWTFASWTSDQLISLGRHARTDTRRTFTRRLLHWYRENRLRLLRNMVDRWYDIDSFDDRRQIIREALLSHRDRRYRVAIPALIPLVEGIVSLEFERPPSTSVSRAVRQQLARVPELHEIEASAISSALDALYKSYDGATLSPHADDLNRHAIAHGHLLNYGIAANSLRMFAILDMLHSQVETLRQMPGSAA